MKKIVFVLSILTSFGLVSMDKQKYKQNNVPVSQIMNNQTESDKERLAKMFGESRGRKDKDIALEEMRYEFSEMPKDKKKKIWSALNKFSKNDN